MEHTSDDIKAVQNYLRDGSLTGALTLIHLTMDGYDSNDENEDKDEDEGAGSSFLMDLYAVDFGGEGAGLHGMIMIRQAEFVALAVLAIAVSGVVVVVVVVVVSFCCSFPGLAEKSYHGGDMGWVGCGVRHSRAPTPSRVRADGSGPSTMGSDRRELRLGGRKGEGRESPY